MRNIAEFGKSVFCHTVFGKHFIDTLIFITRIFLSVYRNNANRIPENGTKYLPRRHSKHDYGLCLHRLCEGLTLFIEETLIFFLPSAQGTVDGFVGFKPIHLTEGIICDILIEKWEFDGGYDA